jgi:hypothetical protein
MYNCYVFSYSFLLLFFLQPCLCNIVVQYQEILNYLIMVSPRETVFLVKF